VEQYVKSNSKSFIVSQEGDYSIWNNGDPQVTKTSYHQRASYDASFLATGFYNPSWKDQVRNLQDAGTAYAATGCSDDPQSWVSLTFNQFTVYVPAGVLWSTRNGSVGGYMTTEPPPPLGTPSSSTISQIENRALSKFLTNIQSIQSSIEAGQDFGEYKETLKSIHSPLSSLRQGLVGYLSALRKRRKGSNNIPALRKILTDTYLEFHFGWQPLVDDIAQIFADSGRFRFPIYPVRGNAHGSFNSSASTVSKAASPLPNSYTYNTQTIYEYSCRYKGAVRSNASGGQLSWAQSLRLTPKDWLPTAWDLLPYSWIADYFTNVGDILQAASLINCGLVYGSKTTQNKATKTVSNVSYVAPPETSYPFVSTTIVSGSGGSYVSWRKSVNRTPVREEDLIPSFSVRIPTGKYPFLNMGALLLQRSAGLRPFFNIL